MSPPTREQRAFAAHLKSLADAEDRAALASLRRGLGKRPGTAAEMHRHVVPWLLNSKSGGDWGYYLIASLFGLHPLPWPTGGGGQGATNLGASLAQLRQGGGTGVERRFEALLDSHRDDLPDRLRQTVGLLKAKDVPVDWAQLLHDILGWDWPSRSVQQTWARAFWGSREEDEGTTADEEAAPEGTEDDVEPEFV